MARLGYAALHLIALSAAAPALMAQRELLLARARKAAVGCEAGSWAAALPAAVTLTLVRGARVTVTPWGRGPRARPHDALLAPRVGRMRAPLHC